MAETTQSKALMLAQVCAIGQGVLDECEPLTVHAEERRGEPVHETYAMDVISEPAVRAMTKRVLARLAALPPGTRTSLPQTLVIGGVKQQAIYKGNIALSFRLHSMVQSSRRCCMSADILLPTNRQPRFRDPRPEGCSPWQLDRDIGKTRSFVA